MPPTELDEAKRALAAGFVLSLEIPAQRLGYLSQRKIYGFSSDYWNTYPAKIMEVTPAE